ncbi:hypothetical protein JCGZ_01306 [Jatropha curcas]|uniref:Uncharacterized protein n=1 Tax=Jatropha curcas TaxID=180498 RepID=A0A067L8N4_JATCU|nr:hypothetical protein JCGZ_01306 [Jatropha curcas]
MGRGGKEHEEEDGVLDQFLTHIKVIALQRMPQPYLALNDSVAGLELEVGQVNMTKIISTVVLGRLKGELSTVAMCTHAT